MGNYNAGEMKTKSVHILNNDDNNSARSDMGGRSSMMQPNMGGSPSMMQPGMGGTPPMMQPGMGGSPSMMRPGMGGTPSMMQPGMGGSPSMMQPGMGGSPSMMQPGMGGSPSMMQPGMGGAPFMIQPNMGGRPPVMQPGMGGRPPMMHPPMMQPPMMPSNMSYPPCWQNMPMPYSYFYGDNMGNGMLSGSEYNEEDFDRELEQIMEMYPVKAKEVQKKVVELCDSMDYEGSMIYDEYPDRFMLKRYCDKIYQEVAPQAMEAEAENNDVSATRRPPCINCNDGIRDLVDVLFFNEIFRRRCRRGRCRH